MKRSSFRISAFAAVGIASGYLLLYELCFVFEWSLTMLFVMFFLSPIIVIGMVLSVLMDPYEPKKTFEEYYYQDVDVRHLQE